MKNRFYNIIKWVFITFLTLLILVFILNEIVYRTSIPENFSKSKWKGKWNSSQYTLVSGKILTTIPENSENQNTKFKSKTLIYYNLWSIYKPGKIKIVDLTGELGFSNISGNNELQKRRSNELKSSSSGFFKAKISFRNGQFIKYDGMKGENGTKILGDYNSYFPRDEGTFELNRK